MPVMEWPSATMSAPAMSSSVFRSTYQLVIITGSPYRAAISSHRVFRVVVSRTSPLMSTIT